MAYKTFTDGVALPASDLNTYLMRQAVIVTTAAHSGLPTPAEGNTIYETDTDRLLVYTTATTGWQPPWNLPFGDVATTIIDNSTSRTTLTFSGRVGRKYLALAHFWVAGVAVSNAYAAAVVTGTASGSWQIGIGATASGTTYQASLALPITPSTTGTVTVTTDIYNTTFQESDGTRQIAWTVLDIGPSGSPA